MQYPTLYRSLVLASTLLGAFGCTTSRSQPSYPQQYPPAAPSAAQAAPPVGPSAPMPAPGVAVLPAPNDPINTVDIVYLRGQAQALLNELVATLPAAQQ